MEGGEVGILGKAPPTHAKVRCSSFAQALWTAEPVIISGVTDTQLL